MAGSVPADTDLHEECVGNLTETSVGDTEQVLSETEHVTMKTKADVKKFEEGDDIGVAVFSSYVLQKPN